MPSALGARRPKSPEDYGGQQMLGPTRPTPDQRPTGNSAWCALIQSRWGRLQVLIGIQERSLARSRCPRERANVEHSLRLLKRVALSVWLDAQREGLALSPENSPPNPHHPDREDVASW